MTAREIRLNGPRADRRLTPRTTVIQIMKNQARPVKNWPALIRFFQKMATAGQPSGRKRNGERLPFLGLFSACQLPERAAVIRSANFFESSTEASSKATLARIIHQ